MLCQDHAYAVGAIRPLVSSGPAQQRIRDLLDAGWSRHAIGSAAGIAHTTATAVLEQGRIRHDTAKAIMSVPVTPPPERGHHPELTRRRLQALRAAGWTLEELSGHTGIGVGSICSMTRDDYDHRIPDDKATTVHDAYERLGGRGVIRPASIRVQARRWVPPMVWDDIDDLDETHVLEPGNVWVAGAVLAQLLALLDALGSMDTVSQACGVHRQSLNSWLSGRRAHLSIKSARGIYRATRELRKEAAA